MKAALRILSEEIVRLNIEVKVMESEFSTFPTEKIERRISTYENHITQVQMAITLIIKHS